MRFFLPRPDVDWNVRKHAWLVFLCDQTWMDENTPYPHQGLPGGYLERWMVECGHKCWREVDAEEFRRWVDGC